MQVQVYYTPLFDRKYKKYLKKFHSLSNDLKQFLENLSDANPVNMGGSIFKYRLSIESKNKGKSGGFRIISFEILVNENKKDITLLTLYDKSEQDSISKAEILEILKSENLI
jgi:hypothetical protein